MRDGTAETKVEAEPEVKKVSLITKVTDTLCGLIGKVVGCVKCVLSKVLDLVMQVLNLLILIKDKFLGLPWDCIISLISHLGMIFGATYAYWTLTNDELVFAVPIANIVEHFVLPKIEAKTWMDAKGVHLVSEILKTVKCGVVYHIYKTHVSLSQPI